MSGTFFTILYFIIGIIFWILLASRFAYKFKNSEYLQSKYQHFESYISESGYDVQLVFTLLFWPISLSILLCLIIARCSIFIIKCIFKIN